MRQVYAIEMRAVALAARGDRDAPSAQDAVALHVKALGGRPLHVRPRSSDVDMIWCTYAADWYLPPAPIENPEPLIVELGTNIGAALAGLADNNAAIIISGNSLTFIKFTTSNNS